MDNIQKNQFDSSNLIIFIFKRWKIIGVFTLLSAVLAGAASFLITPEFESTAILYPPESTSFAKTLATDLSNRDFLEFGDEEEVEKMLQVLTSNRIRNMVIDNFDLYNHYEIDKDSKYSRTKIIETFKSNVNISRTKYLSIIIRVKDQNPQMAADIANAITDYIDTVYNDIRKQRADVAMALLNKRLKSKNHELDVIRDSITLLTGKGIHNYNAQAERYSEAFAKALASGNRSGAEAVRKELNKLTQYANIYNNLSQKQTELTQQLAFIKKKVEETEIAIDKSIPNKFVIETAEVSDKKASPVRSLIVLIATFVSFLFITLLLMIINYSKKPE